MSIEDIDKELVKIDKLLQDIKGNAPFWFFEANDGELTEDRKRLLGRYLKGEDIPIRVDSQLDVLLSKAEIKGVSGGNRSSKTTTGCIDGLIKSIGELPYSLECYREGFKEVIERAHSKFIRGRVVGVDNKQMHRVILPMWQYWTPKEYLKNNSWNDSYSKEFDVLTLYRDRKPCASVEFLTNAQDAESSQGGDLDWVKFDEEPDRGKYKESLMRFGTSDRLDVEIDWTPTQGLTWSTDLFHHGILEEDGPEKNLDIALFKLTSVCNRFVKPDTIMRVMDEYAKVASYEEIKMRLLGEAISLSGLIYSSFFDPKVHVIEPFWESVKNKEDYLCVFGCDPHLVTPTAGVFVLVDRENNCYVDYSFSTDETTEGIKDLFWSIVRDRGYRVGWSVADKSSDTAIMAFGGRNIYKELKSGGSALPSLRTSEKYEGSIKAGVDIIKRRLKERTLFIINRPVNKDLIQSFRTIERDTYVNEDKKGEKDRIREGKHHKHAALRYVFQFPVCWYPAVSDVPQPMYHEEVCCW